jgi:hypothetical protein
MTPADIGSAARYTLAASCARKKRALRRLLSAKIVRLD